MPCAPAPRAALLLLLLLPGCARELRPGGAPAPAMAASRLETRLYLIGDAGKPAAAGEPVLAALSREIARDPARSFVVFLGDNIYPRGLAPPGSPRRPRDERRLTTQLDVLLRHRTPGILVAGNHDWAKHGRSGDTAIVAQEALVREYAGRVARGAGYPSAYADSGVALLPSGGCPGPAVRDVGRRLRIVALDTQWWLHPPTHPRPGERECPRDGTEREAEDSLAATLASAGGRDVVVVAHHPIASGGEHGGFFPWIDHLFPLRALKSWLLVPLPGLGSLVPLSRAAGYSPQDLASPAYCRLRSSLARAFAASPPLLYAAGHDHNLQVFRGPGARYAVVSGAGVYGHTSAVTRRPGALFAARASGFVRLDVPVGAGPARLGVLQVDSAGAAREVYGLWLDATTAPATTRTSACAPLAAARPSGSRALRGI